MAFLYLTEQGSVLKKTGQRFKVEKDGQKLLDIPAIKIEGILIFGNVQFTTQALRLMFSHDIEMAIFTRRGKLIGQLTSPMTKNIDLRRQQYAKGSDPDFLLNVAKSIVAGKIANGLELIREFRHNHPETDLKSESDRLRHIIDKVYEQADIQSLLGIEGTAARVYFASFARMLRCSFEFDGRRKRPATDPVNALLSLGYTMVYNEISSLLDGMGFDPYLGFYHQPHYGHATLASDLMEEFRSALVDRLALRLVNNRVLKEEDFFTHTASGGIYLKDESRKRFFAEYEGFVTREMAVEGERTSFRQLFRRQAERLKHCITESIAYKPYVFMW